MKRIRAAVLAVAVIAGTALPATPAHALSYCQVPNGTIICEYGVTHYNTARGVQMEFAVGTDLAAYVRTTTYPSEWSNWSSLGGAWKSRITPVTGVSASSNIEFAIIAKAVNDDEWINEYAWDGTRTGWHHYCPCGN